MRGNPACGKPNPGFRTTALGSAAAHSEGGRRAPGLQGFLRRCGWTSRTCAAASRSSTHTSGTCRSRRTSTCRVRPPAQFHPLFSSLLSLFSGPQWAGGWPGLARALSGLAGADLSNLVNQAHPSAYPLVPTPYPPLPGQLAEVWPGCHPGCAGALPNCAAAQRGPRPSSPLFSPWISWTATQLVNE